MDPEPWPAPEERFSDFFGLVDGVVVVVGVVVVAGVVEVGVPVPLAGVSPVGSAVVVVGV